MEVTEKNYEKLFREIINDVYSIELALHTTRDKVVEKLLADGVQASPKDAFEYLNMLHTRLIKISTVKRICMAYGLQGEMDKIIDAEMSLLYDKPRSNSFGPEPVAGARKQ